jgi:pimeloyl-ACP methyl ester carboxylesterase
MISRMAAAALSLAIAGAAAAEPVQTYVQVQGPSGVLKGTMLAPAEAKGAPVALIIPGSGPTDRDGNSPAGVKASTYRLLAEALADRGVTSVRIDKRGMFASGGAAVDANHVTITDYADDAHAWAAELRRETGAPCVWLIGHSEGALVAEVASQDSRDICGLVLIAGAGRRLGDVLRQQLSAAPGFAPDLPAALADLALLEKGQHVDATGMDPTMLSLFRPSVQDFVIDELRYDPVRLLAAYKGPALVVQGTTDLQVSVADADLLAGARPGITLIKLEGVNHVLKAAPADRPANVATYADPSLPLAPGVAGPIAAFVKGGAQAK